MTRSHSAVISFLAAAALVLSAASASAQLRVETLRWTHPNPSEVAGFRVHYGLTSGVYLASVNVGVPAKDSSGAYVYPLSLTLLDTVYVSVTAYDADGVSSPFSNEKVRAGTDGGGGEDGGGGGGGGGGDSGAQGAVTGFALWNATTDSVVDSDFRSGEMIDLAIRPCTSIQILVNSYLDQRQAPGSVKKTFDGQTLSCNAAPTSHENSAPFAWETDRGPGQYDCAPSLTTLGHHTLTVTPYDGDDCSGLAGAPVTLDFEVVDSSSGDGSSLLGAPGRPYIVQ
jgi:hypothetical protein